MGDEKMLKGTNMATVNASHAALFEKIRSNSPNLHLTKQYSCQLQHSAQR
jgi:hypothetical protein